MSPIECIEEGILLGNWETVCEGYERLTGKSLPLPKIATMTKDAIVEQIADIHALRQIADIASSALNKPTAEICNKTSQPTKRKSGRPKGNTKKKTKNKTTITKDGHDSSIKLDDNNKTVVQRNVGTTHLITNDPDPEEVKMNKIKAKQASKNKLKLNRQTTKTYEVRCNECEKSFQSNRPEGEMGQKCSKCLNGLKSRFS